MAATAVHLTSGGAQNPSGTSFNTASISPTANRLVVACVHSHQSGDPAIPTLAGAGLTWVQAGTVGGNADANHRITLFRAVATNPSAGALTFTFGASQDEVLWSVVEFTELDTVVQTVATASGGVGTGASVTLGAFSSLANATFGFLLRQGVADITPGTGFSEVNEYQNFNTTQTQFRVDNDTSVDWSWSGNDNWLAAAMELSLSQSGNDDRAYFM